MIVKYAVSVAISENPIADASGKRDMAEDIEVGLIEKIGKTKILKETQTLLDAAIEQWRGGDIKIVIEPINFDIKDEDSRGKMATLGRVRRPKSISEWLNEELIPFVELRSPNTCLHLEVLGWAKK